MKLPLHLFASCVFAFVLSGCGQPVGTVAGKVTYKNAPVTEGAVIFQNAGGTVSVSGNLSSEGTFKIATADRPGLPPGDYKVAVTPNRVGSGEAVLAAPPGEAAAKPPAIPAKYHSIETSDLTATVKAGDNPPFNFELKE
jgi:hypothetical protein